MELGADELKRRPPGKSTLFAGVALALGVTIHQVLTRNGGLPWRVQWLFPLLTAALIGCLLMGLFGPRPERPRAKSPLRRLSPALAYTLVMSLILAAGWILFSRRFSRDFEVTIRTATIIIAAAIILILLARFAWELRQAATDETFNYRLSTIPPLLCGAIVLALIAGWPLKLEERRAVAAMDAGNIKRLSHEVDQGSWQALKDRMQSFSE